jgi:3-hydroxybutyryl-CoA dehydrogenase
LDATDIRRIAVIGAGLMGHGIALELAAHGYRVALHDRDEALLDSALRRVDDSLALLARNGLLTAEAVERARANLSPTAELGYAVAEADLVVEAVYEDLALKQRIFRDVDAHAPKGAILASNTSTFMPSLLAGATHRPSQVLVAHYFNPPHLTPLVEVVRGPETSDETVETVRALLAGIGKRPVVIQKETLGFVGNRLQIALLREALAIVEAGVASIEDVDAIVTCGFGRRLAAAGPFEIFDLAGLEVVQAVAVQLLPEIASTTTISPVLAERVAQGNVGPKSGQGFYPWTEESAAAARQRIGRALAEIAGWPGEAAANDERPGVATPGKPVPGVETPG